MNAIYKPDPESEKLRNALESINTICDETHCARDRQSQLTEIRSIVRWALAVERPLSPLNEAEIYRIWLTGHGGMPDSTIAFARAIERAHGIGQK